MKYQSKLNEKKREENAENVEKSVWKESESAADTDKSTVAVCQRSSSIEEIEIVDRSNKTSDTKFTEPVKSENRKRLPDEPSSDNIKRIKLSSVSHLQLMQDVVALIDDLITRVCDMVSQKERTSDEVLITLSSDESNEPRLQKKKIESKSADKIKPLTKVEENKKSSVNILTIDPERKADNVQDLMDALMKQAMEISQETQQSSADDEDTRRYDGKWLQNEDLQPAVRLSDPFFFLPARFYQKKKGKKKQRNGFKLQEKNGKDKIPEKRKTQTSANEEVTLSRRGSQESTTTTQTTTTTTETNNSSSSSSEDSTSSDDSSDTESTSDSDSESSSDDSR